MIVSLGLILIIGFAIGFVIYHLAKFVLSINNPKSKLLERLRDIAIELSDQHDFFLPIDEDLWYNVSGEIKGKSLIETRLVRTGGVLISIFEEPIFAYYTEKTPLDGVDLLAFCADKFEFQAIKRSESISLYQNSLEFGRISIEYKLIDTDGQKYGEIKSADGDSNVLLRGDQEIAKIKKPHLISRGVNERILSEVNDSILNTDDKLKALLFYYLTREIA